MNAFMNVMHTTTCNCAACAPVPTLGIEMPYEVVKENCLAVACPEAAAMLSDKDRHFAFEVTTGSKKRLTFVCPNCGQEFETCACNVVHSVMNGCTGCPVCAGKRIVPGINDLASKYPEIAAMWSGKNKLSASEVTIGTCQKFFFECRNCGQEFESRIQDVVRSVSSDTTGCPTCAGKRTASGINDLASQCPKAAAMWSGKNTFTPSEVAATSSKKAVFVCHDCGQEFEARVRNVVHSVMNGRTGCPVCAGQKVVPGINDLASKYPEIAAMWSSKNKLSASEVAVKSNRKAFFKCRDCGREFEAVIRSVVNSVNNGFTGCYECKMRRINAISKPECFVVRPMLAFAGENGIANPFMDVRNILGNGRTGLDFVDHIQKLCAEYNGIAWHKDKKHAARDRFKFEAARKAGYAMIRVLEPGLEVLDPKYDIVMPEGFMHGNAYVPEIMEEVGRKVIHLLEEIYGRKASPEIWALNSFKEFEVWYNANKKELEANALENMLSHKTAAKKAA